MLCCVDGAIGPRQSGLSRVPRKAVAAAWPHPPPQHGLELDGTVHRITLQGARPPDASSSGIRRHPNAGVAATGAPPSRLRQPQAVATCKQNKGSWVLRLDTTHNSGKELGHLLEGQSPRHGLRGPPQCIPSLCPAAADMPLVGAAPQQPGTINQLPEFAVGLSAAY